MLANLSGFGEKERIDFEQMPELERFMLARLAEMDGIVRKSYENFDFGLVNSTLFNFCTNDLSAFYFDIRKDALYCDAASSARRRATRTVTDEIFRRIVTWFAPILCFTMEEAWLSRFPGEEESVHLQTFFDVPAAWKNPALVEKWKRIRELRRVVTGALELERAAKKIGSSLEASPTLYVESEDDAAIVSSVPFAEIAIISGFGLESVPAAVADREKLFALPDVRGAWALFEPAHGNKCARCWMILTEVGRNKSHTDLCNRCSAAVP